MKNIGTCALFVLMVAGVNNALAQDNNGLSIQGDAAYLGCLTPMASERGSPQYPERQLALRNGARIVAEMTFESKDQPPLVKLRFNTKDEDARYFTQSVEEYVKRYRLPCLDKGEVKLAQLFNFVPDARKVVTGILADTTDPLVESACRIVPPDGKPDYPASAAWHPGRAILELKFVRADAAPEMRTIFNGKNEALAQSALDWAKRYRLRCAKPLLRPVVATKRVLFLSNENIYAIKDMGFIDLLRSVQRSDLAGARFDMNTMSCPFDLRMTLYQPYADNLVGELESHDPNRKDLLAWMRRLRFMFPGDSERYLVGESLTVSVPCMILDL